MTDHLIHDKSKRPARRVASAVVVAGSLLLAGHEVGRPVAAATTSTTPSPPTTIGTTAAPTTTVPLTLDDGVFTSPDGSFSVAFAVVPSRTIDAANQVESYLVNVGEDSQSVASYPHQSLGASATSSPTERAEAFLASAGTEIEMLADSATRLGPFPAAHFIARITLAGDKRAVVYGLVVHREKDVVYVVYTDVGADDNEAATTFVESYTLRMEVPPAPTSTTTTSASTTTPATTTPATTTTATPTTVAGATTTTVTVGGSADVGASSTAAEPAATATAPSTTATAAMVEGSTVSYDRRWSVTFPGDVRPAFRASTQDGFAYAEYVATADEDTMTVRVTEVPEGYDWVPERVPEELATRVGGTVRNTESLHVGGSEAVGATIDQDDGQTLRVLVVNGGDQIYTVSFVDGGDPSDAAVTEFLDSFQIV